ncbi:MAG TPA: glutathione S-transferase family protein [Candidatus Binatia bacterium]|nr:glutathione S-transferase family protein [Candidatus Binatia bacterium]
MKLYAFAFAPNPRKVLTYLKEKGLDVPIENVDLMQGQNRTPEFLKKNPLGGLPVLELDDGSYLTESLAIMEYFEELRPNPPMVGTTPLERARVRELERLAEIGVMSAVGAVFQNTSPFFAGRVKQSPEAAETGRMRFATNLTVLNDRIGNRPFVAGERPSIADCTLFAALQFGEFAGVPLDAQKHPNVARWYESFKKRPSAQG